MTVANSDVPPFSAYPQGGRTLLGKTKGDVARRGYGRDVLAWCGFRCSYCSLDMGTFEGWLQMSIDHVIPQQMTAAGYPGDWVLDATNVVACCRSCNDLFNRDPVIEAAPTTLEAFFDLRDRVYLARRKRIVERRDAERAWFADNVVPLVEKARVRATAPAFSRAWLSSSGFSAFVAVSNLQGSVSAVPVGPGVYAVLRDATTEPRFLATSRGGWFKGMDPTAPAGYLESRWHAGTPILYFGKADSLRTRIKALVRFAAGEPVGHWGGRFLWQVDGCESFEVTWREADEPRELERQLLADFAAQFALPFANINA